jgi:hypothetical protein
MIESMTPDVIGRLPMMNTRGPRRAADSRNHPETYNVRSRRRTTVTPAL